MADNVQKTPAGLSLNRFARTKALDQIWKRSLSLPCSVVAVRGPIVQVSFQVQQPAGMTQATLPNVTIPVAASEYTRLPIQVGCKGVAQAADAYLGGMSGLGGGVATLGQSGNLTALVFQPIGNGNWFSVDGNVLVLYGPNGVTLMDQAMGTVLNVTPTGWNVSNGTTEVSLTASSVAVTVGANVLSVSATAVTATTPKFVINTLPTSPGSAGQLWNDGGVVMVS